jgi:hypothetical protein
MCTVTCQPSVNDSCDANGPPPSAMAATDISTPLIRLNPPTLGLQSIRPSAKTISRTQKQRELEALAGGGLLRWPSHSDDGLPPNTPAMRFKHSSDLLEGGKKHRHIQLLQF